MRMLLAFCSLASIVGAQQFVVYPEKPSWQPFAGIPRPALFAMADIDNDGDSDAAIADPFLGSATRVLHNTGNQIWAAQQVMPIAADAMAWADMDGDLDPDLLLGSWNRYFNVSFGVSRNDGGSFTWLGAEHAPFGPGVITGFGVGDVDGDLDLDVVVGGGPRSFGSPPTIPMTGPVLMLFRNDGAGGLTYDAGALPTYLDEAMRPVVLDVDGDGDQDIVAARDPDLLVLLTNDGTGTFTDDTALLPAGITVSRLASGDLDDDLLEDLVCCHDGGTTVLWSLPGGTFLPPQQLAPGTAEGIEPKLGDVDGDGRLDVLVRTRDGFEQRRNAGNRTFGLDVMVAGDSRAETLAVGDTMARGFDDVICTFSDESEVLAFGTAGGLVLEPMPRPDIARGIKATGDLDDDGLEDFVVQRAFGPIVMRNAGRGVWEPTTSSIIPPESWKGMRLLHLDADGQLDAVLVSSQAVHLLSRQPASLEFTVAGTHGVPATGDLDVGDVNGDDLDDCVVSTSFGAMQLLNTGTGSLAAPSLVPGISSGVVWVTKLHDLDDDDDLDLLVGPLASCMTVFWNNGGGSFSAGPCLPTGGAGVRESVIADFDGDGRPDVAFVTLPAQELLWFRQLPGGSFAAGPSPAPLGVDPEELHAVDFDDDGDIDLLVTGGPAVLLRNDGAGVFTADPTAIRSRRELTHVAVVDLDQDGDRDLVVDTDFGDRLVMFENRLRSARSVAIPRSGASMHIDFYVDPGNTAPGTLVIPAGTFRIEPGVAVPGVHGTLLIGPTPFNMPWVTIASPQGNGSSITAVPPSPELVGASVAIQGLVASPLYSAGFTNVIDEHIRP